VPCDAIESTLKNKGMEYKIDYDNARRKDWGILYKELYKEKGYLDANTEIWDKWNNVRNKNKGNFKNPELFILSIATDSNKNEIGSNGIFTITADSIPVYSTWTNWWNSVYWWELEQWELWFTALINKYGLVHAQQRFINAWTYADNWAKGFVRTAIGWAGCYDCDFINFCRLKGIDIACTGAESVCTLVNVGTNLLDATENVSEGAVNVTSGMVTFTQLLPVLLIAGTGFYVYNQIKK